MGRPIGLAFEDVRSGDVIGQSHTTITEVRIGVDGEVKLFYGTGDGSGKVYFYIGQRGQPLWLYHRPWPEGKTEGYMYEKLLSALHDFRKKGFTPEWLPLLRKAMDDYELGLPLPQAQKPSRGGGSYEEHFDSQGHSRGVGADD